MQNILKQSKDSMGTIEVKATSGWKMVTVLSVMVVAKNGINFKWAALYPKASILAFHQWEATLAWDSSVLGYTKE